MAAKQLNVLVCGGGCAGPAVAYWLARAGHKVTIVERHPVLRAIGAQIDLRAQGIQVVKKMGLIDTIRKAVVHEDGVKITTPAGVEKGVFRANRSGVGAQTMSSEYEIMRGDLVRILYEHTKDSVEYVFGKTVETFEDDANGVVVHFSDGQVSRYDLLIGADGQGSRIRKAILPADEDPIRHLGMHLALWDLATIETDESYARVTHLPGGRMAMLRTQNSKESQAAYMLRSDDEAVRSIPRAPVEQQKQFWSAKFKDDAGWASERFIKGMDSANYFYSQEIVQVKTKTWYKGHVVLLADAAHCPSPMTGMGTTSGFVGAYVLAGEISKSPDDLAAAFKSYDHIMRPFVDEIQTLNVSLFKLMAPETAFGIWLMHLLVGFMSFFRVVEVMARFSTEERGGFELPDYPLLKPLPVA